jgi:hypothetical protein
MADYVSLLNEINATSVELLRVAEMDGAYDTHGEDEKYSHHFNRKT